MIKNLICVTDDEGKQVISFLRAIIGILATILTGTLITWFVWVSQQAYDVATNKKLIAETAARLERSIGINEQNITLGDLEVESQQEKDRMILHTRITKVDDKYDEKVSELQKMLLQTNTLVVEMLIQKNKEVQLKQKEIEIKEKTQNEIK